MPYNKIKEQKTHRHSRDPVSSRTERLTIKCQPLKGWWWQKRDGSKRVKQSRGLVRTLLAIQVVVLKLLSNMAVWISPRQKLNAPAF